MRWQECWNLPESRVEIMKNLYYDVVIAGCGVAGLYAALNLPKEMNILMISKEDLESCDSMLAQGGILSLIHI